MANTSFIKGSNVRIYKDGVYIGTATGLTTDTTQNMTSRTYIGDDEEIMISADKDFTGSLTRDMTDESFLEHIIGRSVTNKFAASNYEDVPDAIKGTVDSVTDVDSAVFTTPNKTGLTLQSVSINGARVGSFTGGLDIEVWEGVPGVGTLKATINVPVGTLPTGDNEYITAYVHPESAEVAITSNVAHQLRLTPAGAPTGDFNAYGPTAASDFYFAVEYEMAEVQQADYVLDIVMSDDAGAEVTVIRDTQITFTSDNLTMNPNEPVSEATGWTAKKRQII